MRLQRQRILRNKICKTGVVGLVKKKKDPLRQCVGCREMKGKKEMVRVIRTPENEIVMDLTGRKNGRGAYVCRSLECFDKAKKSKAFERALNVAIPELLYDTLRKELEDAE
ncbi:MAG: RNase P modulator RnpM [Lachnospiraceae bacterium]